MGRHFVTVLGTGNYSECVYEMNNPKFPDKTKLVTTPFVQMAILENIMPQYRPGDRITVFATKTAEDKNRKSVTAVSDNRTQVFQKEFKFGKKIFRLQCETQSPDDAAGSKPGLETLLQERFPQARKQFIRIPEGQNEQELGQIFECIYGALSDGEYIFFDFTHGLRNLPMLALAVVNYAKVLKKVRVKGLYYGAYELGNFKKSGAKTMRHVPILDMSFCSEIQDWTGAAETFVKTGSSELIQSLYQSQNAKNKANPVYQDVLASLYDLTGCLATSRGCIDLADDTGDTGLNSKTSIYYAYTDFKSKYEELLSKDLTANYHPIERLVEYIYDDVKILDSTKLILERDGQRSEMRYTALGMGMARWAHKKNLMTQGFISLSEAIISYVWELYDVAAQSDNVFESREAVRTMIRGVKLRPKREYTLEDREQWITRWAQNNSEYAGRYGDKAREILSTLPLEVFRLAQDVAADRNSLAHGGTLNHKTLIPYDVLRASLATMNQQMEAILRDTPGMIQ
ncbi:MAG: TIGR02221 family CRISPR-associated protein [Clostridium sp.]|nr:TIGR02221 family CRISPR-associated protein [Acetatifactor muris]MCM1527272.1 TIGR02221 family CRISPR-associated protein [Bacteroides sp.]MCM1563034.1 TIGR02221 family CRISPR-associated protein [Clostridium sp.]